MSVTKRLEQVLLTALGLPSRRDELVNILNEVDNIETSDINDQAVTTAKLADGSVTEVKLASTSISTAKIQNSAVTDAKLGTAINANKIANGSVSNTEFQYLDGVSSSIQTQLNNKASQIDVNDLHSTGLSQGGLLSIGTPNTTFSISDGDGVVCTYSAGVVTKTEVSWTGLINIPATYVNSHLVSYVAIDVDGNVVQKATPFTNEENRQYIILGSLVHTNLTNLDAINDFQRVIVNVKNQLDDLTTGLGIFNVNGNIFSPNGANLKLNKSAGVIYSIGSNYPNTVNNPNTLALSSLNGLTFQYRFQTGTNGTTGTNINPDIYDVAGSSTPVPSNKFTVQRVYSFVSNNVKIQPGQQYYNTMAEAKANIQLEQFVTEQSISQNGLLRALIIIKQGTSSLNNSSHCFILEANRFQGTGTAGVGGLSVSTLQNAYDNSATPEIVTDSTRGSVDLKRGSAADSDNVFTVQNGSDVTKMSVTGEGHITSTLLIYSALPAAGTGTTAVFDGSNNLIPLSSTRSMKENIRELDVRDDILDLIKPVSYNYKGQDKFEDVSHGFIAEDVANVEESMVIFKDGKPYSLQHSEFISVLWREVQKLNKDIKNLNKDIKLEKQIEKLRPVKHSSNLMLALRVSAYLITIIYGTISMINLIF